MNKQKKIGAQRERRARRTRWRQAEGRGARPRVTVFRSLKNIYAQIIDDVAGTTLVSSSSLTLENPAGDKKAVALAVGKDLAQRAVEKSIGAVLFDRGAYRYHGRVKALADGLREGGLDL